MPECDKPAATVFAFIFEMQSMRFHTSQCGADKLTMHVFYLTSKSIYNYEYIIICTPFSCFTSVLTGEFSQFTWRMASLHPSPYCSLVDGKMSRSLPLITSTELMSHTQNIPLPTLYPGFHSPIPFPPTSLSLYVSCTKF